MSNYETQYMLPFITFWGGCTNFSSYKKHIGDSSSFSIIVGVHLKILNMTRKKNKLLLLLLFTSSFISSEKVYFPCLS